MRKRGKLIVLAVLLPMAFVLGGCGQREVPGQKESEKQTETQTAAPVLITETEKETQTEKPTEKVTEKETETQKLITSVDYTSKDGSIKITLPDNTWKVTQDADEMRVFQSQDAAIINIVHAVTPTTMKSLTVMTSENELKESLTKQYADQDAYEIESFTAGVYDDVDIYRYVVKYNAAARMWAYSVTYAIIDGEEQAYVITGTVNDENERLLEEVKKAVESFRVLGDETLRTVTSEAVVGTAQTETVSTSTNSQEELKSLTDYAANPVTLVTNDNVNVRLQPGTDSDIIVSINKDTKVSVVGETKNWFKVNINGNIGYIRKDFLIYGNTASSETSTQATESTAAAGSSTQAELDTATSYGTNTTLYTSSDVNVRSQPGTDNSVINSVGSGQSVTVVGETDNWFIVSIDGAIGYISKAYLTSEQPATHTDNSGTGNTGTGDGGNGGGTTTPTSPGAVSGVIESASVDTLTIRGDDGSVYTVYYGDASTSSEDGLYPGVYVSASLDSTQAAGDGTLYATSVTGY